MSSLQKLTAKNAKDAKAFNVVKKRLNVSSRSYR